MTRADSSVSERVVRAVADRCGVDPSDMPLLFDTVDPDAIDSLVETMNDGRAVFHYAGYEITVDSRGTFEVSEPCSSGATR